MSFEKHKPEHLLNGNYRCFYCDGDILPGQAVCNYCGTEIEWNDQSRIRAMNPKQAKREKEKIVRKKV